MYISILDINRKSIISWLNNKLYLSDSRHLKSRCVYIVIEFVKDGMGHKSPVHIGTTNGWFDDTLG